MKCERCSALWGHEAVVHIRTGIMDLKVCRQCAKEAYDLGLAYEIITGPKASNGSAVLAAARQNNRPLL